MIAPAKAPLVYWPLQEVFVVATAVVVATLVATLVAALVVVTPTVWTTVTWRGWRTGFGIWAREGVGGRDGA